MLFCFQHLEQLKRGPDTDVTSSSSLTPGDSSSSKKKDRFVQLSAQLAKVSLEHVHCPSAIAKLSEQLQETEKVLEGAKMDFARWKSQAEASLEMERSRAAYTANKVRLIHSLLFIPPYKCYYHMASKHGFSLFLLSPLVAYALASSPSRFTSRWKSPTT